MITQKMAASKDIAATWGGGRAEGAGPGRPAVRTCPEWSGPVRTTTTLQGIGPVFLTGVLPSSRISPSRLPSSNSMQNPCITQPVDGGVRGLARQRSGKTWKLEPLRWITNRTSGTGAQTAPRTPGPRPPNRNLSAKRPVRLQVPKGSGGPGPGAGGGPPPPNSYFNFSEIPVER